MKNLLLASTALLAFAGAAAAEVTVSGQGRFGVTAANGADKFFINNSGGSSTIINQDSGATVAFSSRLRVIFGMSFESDSGLTFGGSTRADNAAAANNGLAGSVFVSGDFGKLQVGDVDSAAQMGAPELSGVGFTGVGDYNETFFLLNGGGDPLANDTASIYADPAALYTYSTGDLNFYVGIGNPAGITGTLRNGTLLPGGSTIAGGTVTCNTAPKTASCIGVEASQQYSLGVKWDNGTYYAGAGYDSTKLQSLGTTTVVDLTLGGFYLAGGATFGGATIKAMYGDITDLDYSQYGMSIDYTFDAFTATAYFRTSDYGDGTLTTLSNAVGTRTAYGFGGAYDLGGGVLVKGGIVDPDLPNVYYQADLGVTFNF